MTENEQEQKPHPEEHVWLLDVRRHPEGEVRLYVDGRLVSGTFALQIINSLNNIASPPE